MLIQFLSDGLPSTPCKTQFGIHCVKSVQIRIFSGPYFPTFWLNTERYEKCANTEFFPGRFVGACRLNMDRHEKYPNAGKYRPEQTPYLDTCILGHLVFGYFSHGDQKSKLKWNAYARKTDNTVSLFWHYLSVLYRWIY